MYTSTCKICNKVVSAELKGRDKKFLATHIKHAHGLTVHEYILEGKDYPLCACGCGNKVKIARWRVNKYYKDHKNKQKIPDAIRTKISTGLLRKYGKTISKEIVDVEKLKKIWEEYVNDKNMSLTIIEQKYGYDKRTIKTYWWKFNITSKLEIKRQAKLHQYAYSNIGPKNGAYVAIPKEKLEEIFNFLVNNEKKYTLNEIRTIFNLNYSTHVIYKRLYEIYEKALIHSLLRFKQVGIASIPEFRFGQVLIFYFGEKNVKFQFKIPYTNKNGRKLYKNYDYILFDKLLIEFDGLYWHNTEHGKKNDLFKNEMAEKHGYKLLRIGEVEAHDINILFKIKELLNEI